MVSVIEREPVAKTQCRQVFSITPIGSCRVSAPLRLTQKDYGFALNKSRTYGYCHSPAEAVQMARFMKGQLTPPLALWPLIARGVDRDATLATEHRPADLYLVELSSAKEITIDGVCVQLNYLTAEFRAFFENNARARHFWEHAAEGDQDAIDRNLNGTQLDADRIDLLRRIRLNIVTEETLRANVAQLQQLLPNILFITHVNALQTDGSPLATRAHFIEMVNRVVGECGGQVFDPTPLMQQVGQRAAIADHSEGLAHFTEDFSRRVVREWHSRAIAPALDRIVIDSDEDAAACVLVPHVAALLKAGAPDGLQDRLDTLHDARPDLKVVNRLRYLAVAAQSDAAASYARLKELRAQDPSDANTLHALRDAAIEMRRYDTALECIEDLSTRGQVMSARQLISLGQDALQARKIAVAVTLFQNAFQQPGKSRKAAGLFAQTALDHTPAVLDELTADAQNRLVSLLRPDLQMRVLIHLQINDPEGSVDVRSLDASELAGLTRSLSDQGEIPRAATLIQRWMDVHGTDARVPQVLRSIIDGWIARADDQTALTDAIALLVSARQAVESYSPTQRALRQTRKTILARMKTLVGSENVEGLEHLSAEVAQFPLPLPELSLTRARAKFVAGDYDRVLQLSRDVVAVWEDNISVWVLMMRAAAKLGDDAEMIKAARRVLALSDPSTQRLEAEAQDRLRRIEAA